MNINWIVKRVSYQRKRQGTYFLSLIVYFPVINKKCSIPMRTSTPTSTSMSVSIFFQRIIRLFSVLFNHQSTLSNRWFPSLVVDITNKITAIAIAMNLILIYCIFIGSRKDIGNYSILLTCFAVNDLIYTTIHYLTYPVWRAHSSRLDTLISGSRNVSIHHSVSIARTSHLSSRNMLIRR